MTDDLLDAECVINHLYDLNIISYIDWKHEHPNDQIYSIYFDNPESRGGIQLEIVKRSGQYYTPRAGVAILAYRHHFNGNIIFSNCMLKSRS